MKSVLQNHIVRRRRRTSKLIQSLGLLGFVWVFVFILSLGVLYTRAGSRAHAVANAEINFQARLLNSDGSIAPDGNTYSVEFNLYNVATGGTTQWTEAQSGVTVRAGYLSVHLGSVTPFPSTIDWSQKQWLTMNVNGDGEMSPRLQLTAVPLALRAVQADGITNGASTLTANDIAQLAPGTPQVINSALAALRLNQTGSGALFQLQHNGTDVFAVANNGDLTSNGSATFSGGSATLGANTQAGSLIMYDGSSNTGTVKTAALGTDRIYTLPDASGTICLSTGNCGGTGDINQNGNSFGTAMTIGTNDAYALNFETGGTPQVSIDTAGMLNIINGGLQIAGSTVLTNAGVLQNVTANTSILTSGTLGVARGGTGVSTFTTKGVIFGDGTNPLQATAAGTGGQLLIADNSGTPIFATLSGDATLSNTGVLTIANGAVSNAKLQNSSFSTSFGTNLSGSASVSLGGTLTVNFSATPTFTSVTANSLTSNTGQDLTLTGATGIINLAANTTLKTTTGLDIDLNSGSNQSLRLLNNGSGVANLNLVDGELQIGGSSVLTSGRALQNLTGISTTGSLVFNSFSGSAGLLKVDTLGNVTVATASDFQSPLLFDNGLTNTSGTVGLGGTLNANTTIALNSKNLVFSGSGVVSVGTTNVSQTFNIGTGSTANFTVDGSTGNVVTAGTLAVNGNALTSSSSSFTLLSAPTNVAAFGAATTLSIGTSAGTTTINGNTLTNSGLTFGGASATAVQAANNQNLTINTQGSGVLSLNTGSTGILQTNATTLQTANSSSDVTLTITNAGSGLANLAVEGTLSVAGGKLTVDTSGNLLGAASSTGGTSTTTNTSGLGGTSTSTSVNVSSSAGFTIGHYIQMNSTNCNGGAAPSVCYAKITNIVGNTLTITPALHWGSGATVNDYVFQEVGGNGAVSPALTSRYGRGYFISGVVTGNGTTYYNEDGIQTSQSTYSIQTTDAAGVINIGTTLGSSGVVTIGNSAATTTIAGAVQFTGSFTSPTTGTAGYLQRSGTTISPTNSGDSFSTTGNISATGTGSLSSGGAITAPTSGNTINGLIINSGALSGISSISATGAITAATATNTINNLVINNGALSSVTGITFSSGNLALGGGNISGAGSIGGTSLSLSGTISANTTNTINGLSINSGALTGVTGITFTSGNLALGGGNISGAGSIGGTSLSVSGVLSANTTNTLNGLSINSGALTGVTGITFTSGNLALGSGNLTTTGTLSANTTNTLNGLNINAGNITGITGMTFASGNLALGGGNISGAGSIGGTSLSVSGVISANTTNTINGLSISSGALTGLTGITFTSGSLNLNSGGITNTGSLAGVTTITATGTTTISTGADASKGLVIKQNSASQSGDLIQFQKSDTTFLGGIAGDGVLNLAPVAGTAPIASTGVLGDKIVLYNNTSFGRYGFGVQALSLVANVGASNGAFVVRVDPGSGQATSASTNAFAVTGAGVGSFASNLSVNGNTLSSTSGTFTLLSTPTNVSAFGAATTLSLGTSTGTTTINGNTLTSTGLTFAGAGATTVQSASGQSLTVQSQGAGGLTLTAGSGTIALGSNTLQRSNSSFTFDLANAGTSTFNISNSNGSNLAGLDVSGSLVAGSGNAFTVNSDGDILSAFTTLDGSTTAAGAGTNTATLNVNSKTNFNVGNYVRITSASYTGGFGYAKITAINAILNQMTISPALTWANGAAVVEMHVPEIGGVDSTTPANANRYGMGYFINGTAAGNGTTYFTEHEISTSLATFGLFSDSSTTANLTTLNLAQVASTINIGASGSTTNLGGSLAINGTLSGITGLNTSGSLSTTVGNSSGTWTVNGLTITLNGPTNVSGSNTFTVGSGLATFGGGISLTGGSLSTGAVPVIRLTNAGGLTNITGLSVISGGSTIVGGSTVSGGAISLNDSSNFATSINTGTSTGTVTIGNTLTTFSLNSSAFDVSSSGALSGITTIGASGLATLSGGATIAGTTNINAGGLLINTNINTGLSTGTITLGGGSAPLVIDSTAFDVTSGGAVSGVSTLTASGNVSTTAGSYISQGATGLTLTACTAGQYIGNGVKLTGGIVTAGSCRNDATTVSDVRLKTDINSVGSVLDRMKELNVVSFQYNRAAFPDLNLDEGMQYGVIAQELEVLFPELVSTRDDGYKEVNLKALGVYNLRAVNEIAQHVDSSGNLRDITGLRIISGGANVIGGINNSNGGITNAGAVTGVTNLDAQSVHISAAATGNLLTLTKDGNGVFTVFNDGSLLMQLDAAKAFNVARANGDSIFNIDTTNGRVTVGSGSSDMTVLFTLDNRNLPDDPPGTNGSSYYNTRMNRFRCYEDGHWTDCLPVGDTTTPLANDRVNWAVPYSEQEFPGAPRVSTNLSRVHEFKLRLRVTAAASNGASCRLQFSESDNGPWTDLAKDGGGDLRVDQAGTIWSDWFKVNEAARKENTIIRMVCKSGNGSQTATFYGIAMPVR